MEQGRDVRQRQPDLAEREDAIEPPDVLFGVETVDGPGALGWDEQAQLVVVMEGANGHACPRRKRPHLPTLLTSSRHLSEP